MSDQNENAQVEGVGPAYSGWMGIEPGFDGIPTSMIAVDQWVLFKAEPKPNGGMNKIPYQPTGLKASSTNPATWSDYGAIRSAYEEGGYAGIGFVVSDRDDFIAGDLDHCRNIETGELTPLASRIVDGISTYWEITPSGTGLRFFGYGDQVRSFRGNGVEVYTTGRFLTVTGERLGCITDPGPIETAHLDRLHELATGKKAGTEAQTKSTDLVVTALKARSLYQHELKDGRHQITCPWWKEHTGGDLSGTVYMEAHHNGHGHASFVCQHSHCGDKRLGDLLSFLGVHAPGDAQQPTDVTRPPPRLDLVPSASEIDAAQLTPTCYVSDYLYADVALLIAPGGTGKTTMMLAEAASLALERPIWGCPVVTPGWTLIISAEDARERLIARLREIVAEMDLSASERDAVYQSVLVWDVVGSGVRLAQVADGNLLLTDLADHIVDAYADNPPAVIVFDPLVSFGASEQAVNDNEQAIVTAARRIVRGLGCCVRLVHHTGKANARAGALDQYAARGGSALSDGARMVTVLQNYDKDSPLRPPLGCDLGADASVSILARAKLSYAPPNLPRIWITRTGYSYASVVEMAIPEDVAAGERADQVERYLASQIGAERYWTRRQLDGATTELSMTRTEIRRAIDELMISSRVIEVPLPPGLRQGSRTTYLCPRYCAEKHGAVALNEAS